MGKVLLADAAADVAWVKFDLLAPEAETWLTFRLAFTAAGRAAMGSGGGADFAAPADDPTWPASGSLLDFLDFDNSSDDWSTGWGSGSGPVVEDAWQLVELRHVNGGGNESQLYINSVLVVDVTTGGATADAEAVFFGILEGSGPDFYCYIDDVKVGTTRGASDLFADNFEDGTLDAWTDTYGAVSVVDDPFPSLQGVSIALTDITLDPIPTWTRLDDPDGYNIATSWSIHRGKASEFDKTGTGIASISFADSTGLLDPTNTTSPFYNTGGTATYLDPMRQIGIALQNPVSGTWFPLFRGFLSEQDHEMTMWADGRGLDVVQWECADAFDLLAAYVLTPGNSGDPTGFLTFSDIYYEGTPANVPDTADAFRHVDDRIIQLLDDAGWPGTGLASSDLRDIFSGNCSVQGKVYERVDQLLSALYDAADAESVAIANIFVSKSGVVTFRGRFPPFFPTEPQYNIATWSVGGMPQALADPTVAPITGLQFRRSKNDIINSVIAMPQGDYTGAEVAAQIVEDAPSIATFGYRGESFTDLQVSAGHTNATPTDALEEARKQAEYIVGNYAQPRTNVSVIQFKSRSPEDVTAPALWEIMTEVEIGDRVLLNTTHVGGGGFVDEYFFVQGIRYEARGARDEYHDVTMELEVIPAAYYDFNPFGTIDGTA